MPYRCGFGARGSRAGVGKKAKKTEEKKKKKTEKKKQKRTDRIVDNGNTLYTTTCEYYYRVRCNVAAAAATSL